MHLFRQVWLKTLVVGAVIGLVAASPASAQPLQSAVGAVPVVQEATPYRPLPPGGAAYAMQLPPLGPDGNRVTLNSNLDDNATLWHVRAAWNVAALNCLDPAYQPVLDGYKLFLRKYARTLSAANTSIDQGFVRAQGSRNAGIKLREAYMTQVYNYFALPPARDGFCDTALAIANEFIAVQPASAKDLAAASLPRYEAVFQEFFRQYEQYQIASAAWDERWGALFGDTQPGYVAVHGAAGAGSIVFLNAPAQTDVGVDPVDAARVSLVAGTEATPVAQAVADSGVE